MTASPSQRRRPWLAGAAATALALALGACTGGVPSGQPTQPTGSDTATGSAGVAPTGQVRGIVVDTEGKPVFGARVSTATDQALTNADGTFLIGSPDRDTVVFATTDAASGYTVLDDSAASEVELRVHPRPRGSTILRFGGDVRTGTEVLGRRAGAADYAALFDGLAPLLQDAAATAVTLATPLVRNPFRAVDRGSSSTALAEGMAVHGIDVVSLATPRIMNSGSSGLASTLTALDQAGIKHAGAGRNLTEAWRPALVTLGEGTSDSPASTVAYVACAILEGRADADAVAATDRLPGAAACETQRLRRELKRVGEQADTVVAMIYGGTPYSRSVDPFTAQYTRTAVSSGADLVVNSGSHVPAEVWGFGRALATQSMGDLVSDDFSTIAATGYLLRVDRAGGENVGAEVEPILRTDGVPGLSIGAPSIDASRQAAADINEEGPLVLVGDTALVGEDSYVTQPRRLAIAPTEGRPGRLADGWSLEPGQAGLIAGLELLLTGSFEDVDANPLSDGTTGWSTGSGVEATTNACTGRGALAVTPGRGAGTEATTERTYPIDDAFQASLVFEIKGLDAGRSATASLLWYDGDSVVTRSSRRIQAVERVPDGPCQLVRLDASRPSGADAIRPVITVTGTGAGESVVVDEVEVVVWFGGVEGGRGWTHLRTSKNQQVEFQVDAARGGTPPPGPWAD